MNLLRDSKAVFECFGEDYVRYRRSLYELVEDSVLLVCGLRSNHDGCFDVYYTCVPVFSYFSFDQEYLNDASGFSAKRDSGIEVYNILPIRPGPGEEQDVIKTASAHAEYAFNRLETIKTLEDCLGFFEWRYAVISRGIIFASPKRFHIDILLFRGEFEKCRQMLEKSIEKGARRAYCYNGVKFPEDGNWRKSLPRSEAEATSPFLKELYYTEQSGWKNIRAALAEGRYRELCSELMQNYQNNKQLLQRIGIHLGNDSDAMMDAMMRRTE